MNGFLTQPLRKGGKEIDLADRFKVFPGDIMKRKLRITSLLFLLPLLLSVSATTPDWVGCPDVSPDEYMDFAGVIDAHIERGQFQHSLAYLSSASDFASVPQLSSDTFFPLHLAEASKLSEQPSDVCLRI
jgi:hypothetical protein